MAFRFQYAQRPVARSASRLGPDSSRPRFAIRFKRGNPLAASTCVAPGSADRAVRRAAVRRGALAVLEGPPHD
jgi:hypothetical protein